MRHLAQAEHSSGGTVQRISRRALALHGAESPTANLEADVDFIEAGKCEEVVVRRGKSFRAADGFIEPFSGHWWCEDEGHIDVEEKWLILEDLQMRSATIIDISAVPDVPLRRLSRPLSSRQSTTLLRLARPST